MAQMARTTANRMMAGSRAGFPVTSRNAVRTKRTKAQNPRKPMRMSKSSPERTFFGFGFVESESTT